MRVAFFPGPGAWSEVVSVPAPFVVPVPDGVSDATASVMLVNALTMVMLMEALEDAAQGRAGIEGPLIQTAAGSAMGTLISAAAQRHGMELISVVRSEQGARVYAERFPDIPVISTDDEGWRDRLTTHISGRPVHAILDAVGGVLARDLTELLTAGGTLIGYGALDGGFTPVDQLRLVSRQLHFRGVSVGFWPSRPEADRAAHQGVVTELATHRPELFPVAAEYPLADFASAIAHVERPGKTGTVLLTND
jgi:NADPH:quinone reductase-like Zn-dependent oxidoreductase